MVERIRLTSELQDLGLTLDEIVQALAAHDVDGATCESERWRLEVVRDRVDARIAGLTALRGRIVQAQEACVSGHCRFARQRERRLRLAPWRSPFESSAASMESGTRRRSARTSWRAPGRVGTCWAAAMTIAPTRSASTAWPRGIPK
jgi:hypothetical protein